MTPKKTIKKMVDEMPFELPTRIIPYLEEAMQLYADAAYNQAIRDAAESAKMKFHDGFHKENKDIEHFQSGQDNLTVSKQSILKLLKSDKSFCECGSQKDHDCKYCTSCNKHHSI